MTRSICILASDSPTSRALISALTCEFPISAVIIERGTPEKYWKMLKYRLKRLGTWKVLGQLIFMLYDRLVIRHRSAMTIKEILAPFGDLPPGLPWQEVDNVNSKEVFSLIAAHKPAVCIVTGTSIIGRRLLATAPVFLNIHCGITPAYRGVHGAFWAVCQRDVESAGVTIHQVDPGVDTGDVVAQTSVTVDPIRDTHRTLVAKQYAAGIPLMVEAVRSALHGALRSHPTTGQASKQWFAPTITDYIQFLRVRRELSREHT